jgi:hypothetical protein
LKQKKYSLLYFGLNLAQLSSLSLPGQSPTEAQPDIPSIVFLLQLEAAAWRS